MSSAKVFSNPEALGPEDVMKRLKAFIAERPDQGWDDAWKNGVTPWDAKTVLPPLRDLIESGAVKFPTSGRALVPGCGKGYDAIFIASTLGLDTLAADISPTAVEAANALLASGTVGAPGAKVTFKEADFFKMTLPEDQKFDLIYDYTFFVAISPSRRLEWGRQITALTKPGAYLITLMFPLDQPPDVQGPPNYLRPEHYDEPLKGWTRILYEEPKNSLPTHVGREMIAVWKKNE
ncbi:hypothetical protein EVG20_g519 [Dentipellis fragilis]|uniref:Methyltransferase domain-containing protein n=1 Tax=Dentipellis fragilis TaxID=205917 RepID=A0A4Y9ZGB6_9AGAM|nr:hypothetical protein EVG20_g519 [Dentipellis fragilis]